MPEVLSRAAPAVSPQACKPGQGAPAGPGACRDAVPVQGVLAWGGQTGLGSNGEHPDSKGKETHRPTCSLVLQSVNRLECKLAGAATAPLHPWLRMSVRNG